MTSAMLSFFRKQRLGPISLRKRQKEQSANLGAAAETCSAKTAHFPHPSLTIPVKKRGQTFPVTTYNTASGNFANGNIESRRKIFCGLLLLIFSFGVDKTVTFLLTSCCNIDFNFIKVYNE